MTYLYICFILVCMCSHSDALSCQNASSHCNFSTDIYLGIPNERKVTSSFDFIVFLWDVNYLVNVTDFCTPNTHNIFCNSSQQRPISKQKQFYTNILPFESKYVGWIPNYSNTDTTMIFLFREKPPFSNLLFPTFPKSVFSAFTSLWQWISF